MGEAVTEPVTAEGAAGVGGHTASSRCATFQDAGILAGLDMGRFDRPVRAELSRLRAAANIGRLRLLLPVLTLLHAASALVFGLARVTPVAAADAAVELWRRELLLANGAMAALAGALALLAWLGGGSRARPPREWTCLLAPLSSTLYVTYAALVSGIDQRVTGMLTAYIVAVFAVALFARIPAVLSLGCYGVGVLALWAALTAFQPSVPVRLSNLVNGVTVTALAWGLSLVLDRNFVRDFFHRRTIDVQRGELQTANDRLAESLEALQRVNAELVQEVRVRSAAERELARLATNDPLTDVPNRRRFLEIAEMERERAISVGGTLSLALLDVDHFKEINDAHGHAVGDEVLRAVAAGCAGAVGESDAVGRLGGDEFVLLLVGRDLAAAMAHSEELERSIRTLAVAAGDGTVAFTVSIGVTEVVALEPGAISRAMQRADDAMYQAKRAGRGRVLVGMPEIA